VRRVNGQEAMQMITGGNGAFTTHWAYMLPLTEATEPPDPPHGRRQPARLALGALPLAAEHQLEPGSPGREQQESERTLPDRRLSQRLLLGRRQPGSDQPSLRGAGVGHPRGESFFNAIDTSSSQGGLLKGPRREA
jgi:hypothetical protein